MLKNFYNTVLNMKTLKTHRYILEVLTIRRNSKCRLGSIGVNAYISGRQFWLSATLLAGSNVWRTRLSVRCQMEMNCQLEGQILT